MAKRGVLEHPKTLALADELGIMDPFALGLLEALWHWVAKYHPNGDVTGTNPQVFARSIRYTGDAEALWAALLHRPGDKQTSGFLDQLEDGRTLVHDWSQHADSTIHKALKKRKELFADGRAPFTREQSQSKPDAQPGHDSGMTQAQLGHGLGMAETQTEHDLGMTQASLPDTRYQIPDTTKSLAPKSTAPSAKAQAALELLPPKAAKHVSTADPRFAIFRDEIQRFWNFKNPGVAMPWDGSEAKKLNELLKACPALDLAAFQRMLSNRGESDVVQSQRPRVWLGSAVDYANGPIDRFGKPAVSRIAPEASVGRRPQNPAALRDQQMEQAARKFEARTGSEPNAEEWVIELEGLDPAKAWADGDRESALDWCQGQIDFRAKVRDREKQDKEAQYARAVEITLGLVMPSTMAIQRGMKVSYAHAVAWLDRMVKDGIIANGPNGFEFAGAEKELQTC